MHKTLSYPLHLKSTLEDGSFSGYASVFDIVDRQNEQVAYGAFTKSLHTWQKKGSLPKMLWQHDPKSPIGVWNEIREDQHGLYVSGQLLLDVQRGQEAYSLIRKGIIDSLSIGFTVARSRKSYIAKTRVLEEIDLHEISLVTFAANIQARITSCKAITSTKDVMEKIQRLTTLIRE
ncbi:MAG: HK97 family phage prohead protease [Alphaproteobacteria bacterium]